LLINGTNVVNIFDCTKKCAIFFEGFNTTHKMLTFFNFHLTILLRV
jgi:hypothetical protein